MRVRRLTIAWVLGACATVVTSPVDLVAQAPPDRLPRIIVDESIQGPPIASPAADALGPSRAVGFGARLVLTDVTGDGEALAARLAMLGDRRIPAWLAIPAPASQVALDAWRAALTVLLTTHGDRLAVLEVTVATANEELRRFALEFAATSARARRSGILIAASGTTPAASAELLTAATASLAPYVDLLLVDEAGKDRQPLGAALTELRLVDRADFDANTKNVRLPAIRTVFENVGTAFVASLWRMSAAALVDTLRALAPIAPLLTHDVSELEPAAVSLSVDRTDATGSPDLPARVLFDNDTFTSYLVYEAAGTGSVRIRVRLPVEAVPVVHDLVVGTRQPAGSYRRDQSSAMVEAMVPVTGRPMVVDFNDGSAEVLSDRTGVAARRVLTVDEIVARHRQQQAAQDVLVRNYSALARMEQHFRPALTDPGYDVVTENRYFVEGPTVEWEELSFSVNGSKWGNDRPPFPLLQPEKVLSQPLELRLGSDYRYRLEGTERVDDIDCYVVSFDPAREDQALYRGTAWINQRTFAKVRVQAVQTRTSAPVISNEETHSYSPVPISHGRTAVLVSKVTAKQIVLIAGRNLLLEKAVTFDAVQVNSDDFVGARAAARTSDRIMYRDTDRGLRYLVKEGETRIVSERATTSARALAMGVLLDPSYAFPLPIFGINYLDFEFRGQPDTQLALLFAGVLAAGNIQRPKLGGTPLDASIDFFGIAAPSSDRVYGQGGERESERVLTWPLTAGLNVGWQYTPFQKLQGHYHLRFDPFVRDATTAETFVLPSSTVTNGVGASWEYRRGGYSVLSNVTWFARASWEPWGLPETMTEPPRRTYSRLSAHISKDVFLNAFSKVHFNGSYFASRHLDRFSRYQFGLFDDTRLHGVPSSGIRFDEVGMVRGSYSFNIFEQYRLDLFLDQAWGRDRAVGREWQPITGVGMALNLRAPWNTILRADLGKSLLPTRYEDVGSTVVQIMVLKPLK